MSDEEKGKTTKVVELQKPRHAEQYSLEECAMFQPWHVILKVQMAADRDPEDYEIYLRAPNPHGAQWGAYGVFCILEKDQHGIPRDALYPDVCNGRGSSAEAISEQEYAEAWKEAQRYPHVKGGMKENPSVFRFVRTGKHASALSNVGPAKTIVNFGDLSVGEQSYIKKRMADIDKKAKK